MWMVEINFAKDVKMAKKNKLKIKITFKFRLKIQALFFFLIFNQMISSFKICTSFLLKIKKLSTLGPW